MTIQPEFKAVPLRRFYMPPDMVRHRHPEISGSEANHICRVLRLSANDAVELFDGTGNGFRATIVSATPQRVQFRIESPVELRSESPVHITLAQGMLKDRKMDGLIRQLTELGIHRWMPFYAARSVPGSGKRGWQNRLNRWEKIALEAVKQCRRGRIPTIMPTDTLKDVIIHTADTDLKIIFWEKTPQAFAAPMPMPEGSIDIVIVVGPEGGFNGDEIGLAEARGFLSAGLGPRILRAETAALAAFTLVQYCYGDMGCKGLNY